MEKVAECFNSGCIDVELCYNEIVVSTKHVDGSNNRDLDAAYFAIMNNVPHIHEGIQYKVYFNKKEINSKLLYKYAKEYSKLDYLSDNRLDEEIRIIDQMLATQTEIRELKDRLIREVPRIGSLDNIDRVVQIEIEPFNRELINYMGNFKLSSDKRILYMSPYLIKYKLYHEIITDMIGGINYNSELLKPVFVFLQKHISVNYAEYIRTLVYKSSNLKLALRNIKNHVENILDKSIDDLAKSLNNTDLLAI